MPHIFTGTLKTRSTKWFYWKGPTVFSSTLHVAIVAGGVNHSEPQPFAKSGGKALGCRDAREPRYLVKGPEGKMMDTYHSPGLCQDLVWIHHLSLFFLLFWRFWRGKGLHGLEGPSVWQKGPVSKCCFEPRGWQSPRQARAGEMCSRLGSIWRVTYIIILYQ